MLDPLLIKKFRNKVNNNSYYVLHKYRNQDGKNRWNIICSAMDWITIAVNNYNDTTFDKDDIDKYCMQVYSFISTIDIICEAIKQLHRALIDNKSIPFKKEKGVFTKNIDKTDNEYFKHIRAVFGAHSIDLNDNNERWFASWPTIGHFSDYDLHVFLYPLASEKGSMEFGLYLKELREFAESRYNYLNVLIERINLDFESYIEICKQNKIKFYGEPLKDAIVCKETLNQRLPNDYYQFMIDDIIRFLSAKNSLAENLTKVNFFFFKVEKALDHIKMDIQKLAYKERDVYKIFDNNYPSDILYDFSKYLGVLQGEYAPFASHHLEIITSFLKPYVVLKPDMEDDEIYLLIHVGLYEWESSSQEYE